MLTGKTKVRTIINFIEDASIDVLQRPRGPQFDTVLLVLFQAAVGYHGPRVVMPKSIILKLRSIIYQPSANGKTFTRMLVSVDYVA